MTTRLGAALATIAILWTAAAPAQNPAKVKVVATFSILGDFVRQVGGERIELTTLVGPNGDAHVYAPTPADGKRIVEARVVFSNGLKFEGWIDRLFRSSGTRASIVEAGRQVVPAPEKAGASAHQGHSHGAVDPHAWQDVANAKIYVSAIRDGLIAADAEGRAVYEANAAAYLAKLDALDAEVRAAIAAVPPALRRVITSHDAFAYFETAYGLDFVAPQGVSTDSEASARDVARIIQQVRKERITAIFVENISDPRLIERIAKESGAKVGTRVYSDALSPPDGPAGTYIDMMRHNIRAFTAALSS